MQLRLRRTTPLLKLSEVYSELRRIDKAHLTLLFKGAPLWPESSSGRCSGKMTLETAVVSDGDTVEALIATVPGDGAAAVAPPPQAPTLSAAARAATTLATKPLGVHLLSISKAFHRGAMAFLSKRGPLICGSEGALDHGEPLGLETLTLLRRLRKACRGRWKEDYIQLLPGIYTVPLMEEHVRGGHLVKALRVLEIDERFSWTRIVGAAAEKNEETGAYEWPTKVLGGFELQGFARYSEIFSVECSALQQCFSLKRTV